jgi:DNA anti-recombination protein RmuC
MSLEDARVTELTHQIFNYMKSTLDQRNSEIRELTLSIADSFEQREHLREDIKYLLAINARLAQEVQRLRELKNALILLPPSTLLDETNDVPRADISSAMWTRPDA